MMAAVATTIDTLVLPRFQGTLMRVTCFHPAVFLNTARPCGKAIRISVRVMKAYITKLKNILFPFVKSDPVISYS